MTVVSLCVHGSRLVPVSNGAVTSYTDYRFLDWGPVARLAPQHLYPFLPRQRATKTDRRVKSQTEMEKTDTGIPASSPTVTKTISTSSAFTPSAVSSSPALFARRERCKNSVSIGCFFDWRETQQSPFLLSSAAD